MVALDTGMRRGECSSCVSATSISHGAAHAEGALTDDVEGEFRRIDSCAGSASPVRKRPSPQTADHGRLKRLTSNNCFLEKILPSLVMRWMSAAVLLLSCHHPIT